MSDDKSSRNGKLLTRREFFKLIGLMGFGTILSPIDKLISRGSSYTGTEKKYSIITPTDFLDPNKINVVKANLKSSDTLIRYVGFDIKENQNNQQIRRPIPTVKSNFQPTIVDNKSVIVYLPFDNEEITNIFRNVVIENNNKIGELSLDTVLFSVPVTKFIIRDPEYLNKVSSWRTAIEQGYIDYFGILRRKMLDLPSFMTYLYNYNLFGAILEASLDNEEYRKKAKELLDITSGLSSIILDNDKFFLLLLPALGPLFALGSLGVAEGGLDEGDALILLPADIYAAILLHKKYKIDEKYISLIKDDIFKSFPNPYEIKNCFKKHDDRTFLKCIKRINNEYLHTNEEVYQNMAISRSISKLRDYKILIDENFTYLTYKELSKILLQKTFEPEYPFDIPYLSITDNLSNDSLLQRLKIYDSRRRDIEDKTFLDMGAANIMIFTKDTFNGFKGFIKFLWDYDVEIASIAKYNPSLIYNIGPLKKRGVKFEAI